MIGAYHVPCQAVHPTARGGHENPTRENDVRDREWVRDVLVPYLRAHGREARAEDICCDLHVSPLSLGSRASKAPKSVCSYQRNLVIPGGSHCRETWVRMHRSLR